MIPEKRYLPELPIIPLVNTGLCAVLSRQDDAGCSVNGNRIVIFINAEKCKEDVDLPPFAVEWLNATIKNIVRDKPNV